MSQLIDHGLSIDEVDFRLRILENTVNDDFVYALEEARKYLDECRSMDEKK